MPIAVTQTYRSASKKKKKHIKRRVREREGEQGWEKDKQLLLLKPVRDGFSSVPKISFHFSCLQSR